MCVCVCVFLCTHVDGVEEQLGDAGALDVDEVRLEQGLGRAEPLAAHANHLAVRQLQRNNRIYKNKIK